MLKKNRSKLQKSDRFMLTPAKTTKSEPVKKQANTKSVSGALVVPDGSGGIVLFAKAKGKWRAVEIVALKSVSPECGRNPLWTIIENISMPHQLTLGFGPSKSVWSDLKRFRVYREQLARMKRKDR